LNHSTTFLLVAIAVGLVAGGLLGTQPSVNGSLGKSVAHPLQASLISFGSGTAILLLLTITVGGGFPPEFIVSPRSLPWWIWFGGAIGVLMVSTSLFIVPRIGSLPWFAAVMTGQTVAALLLDHYGLLGNPRSPISALRLFGTLLLVLGVLAIVGAKQMEQGPKQQGQVLPAEVSPDEDAD
jgi:transporter family-2 protein